MIKNPTFNFWQSHPFANQFWPLSAVIFSLMNMVHALFSSFQIITIQVLSYFLKIAVDYKTPLRIPKFVFNLCLDNNVDDQGIKKCDFWHQHPASRVHLYSESITLDLTRNISAEASRRQAFQDWRPVSKQIWSLGKYIF